MPWIYLSSDETLISSRLETRSPTFFDYVCHALNPVECIFLGKKKSKPIRITLTENWSLNVVAKITHMDEEPAHNDSFYLINP